MYCKWWISLLDTLHLDLGWQLTHSQGRNSSSSQPQPCVHVNIFSDSKSKIRWVCCCPVQSRWKHLRDWLVLKCALFLWKAWHLGKCQVVCVAEVQLTVLHGEWWPLWVQPLWSRLETTRNSERFWFCFCFHSGKHKWPGIGSVQCWRAEERDEYELWRLASFQKHGEVLRHYQSTVYYIM